MSTDAVSDPDAALRQPSLFIPHGGGPCFFMDPADPDRVQSDPMWQPMQDYLSGLVADLPAISRLAGPAIVVALSKLNSVYSALATG